MMREIVLCAIGIISIVFFIAWVDYCVFKIAEFLKCTK